MNAHHYSGNSLHVARNLYQEHAAGTHFLISKDSNQPYFLKTMGPFLSTGNFDQAIVEKEPAPKTFMSCGNFQTSSRQEEGWDLGEQPKEEFQLIQSKYGNHTLEHSSQNVKYNYQYSRSHSYEYVEQTGMANEIVIQNIILTKTGKLDSPSIVNAEPLRLMDSTSGQQTKIKAKKGAYKVKKCEEDDNSSNNEYEMDSEGDKNDENNKNNIMKEDKSIIQSQKIRDSNSIGNNSPVGQQYSYIESPPLRSRIDSIASDRQSRNKNQQNGSFQQSSKVQSSDKSDNSLSPSRVYEPNYNQNGQAASEVFQFIKQQCMHQLLNRKQAKRNDQSSILEDESVVVEESYSNKQLLEMCMESKESSIKVQAYLKQLSWEDLDYQAGYLCKNLDYLIPNKFGNYVVQFLTEIHPPTMECVSNKTLSSYLTYAENEYGSRIMQKLCIISKQYCYHALKLFHKNFDRLIRNITGSILLSKLISASSNEEDYMFAVNILDHNKDYLRKAYFNRMLSTLVSCCSEQTLQDIINLIRSHIWVLMNDKFGNYVLQILIERGQKNGTSMIKQACLKNAQVLLTRKYPKFLVIKIVEVDFDGAFSQEMLKLVLNSDDNLVAEILGKRDSAMLLMLLVSRHPMQAIVKIAGRLIAIFQKFVGQNSEHCKRL